jgi:hypothetical protein
VNSSDVFSVIGKRVQLKKSLATGFGFDIPQGAMGIVVDATDGQLIIELTPPVSHAMLGKRYDRLNTLPEHFDYFWSQS